MRFCKFTAAIALALSVALGGQALAQGPVKGTVVIPKSSIERAEDKGLRAHTNYRIFVPTEGFRSAQALSGQPPYAGYLIETPASVACVYQLTQAVPGCNPNSVTLNPSGGSKAIAIVDAYDAPNAASDLAYFSNQFGLPIANFQVVYAAGNEPPYSTGWELEESLDIEWAHAMAPSAKLYLVEAASNQYSDLYAAIQTATQLVAAAGGGEVSMSWGGTEFNGENTYDSYFVNNNVVYFAATGDVIGTQYPSVSPNVVAVGGTSFLRNGNSGAFKSEAAWEDAGSGPSQYEPRPSYQSVIAKTVGKFRGTPDVVALADPNNSVWVYDSDNGGWNAVGGTSLATPMWAGIVNRAGIFAASSNAELTEIYNNMTADTDYKDIRAGFCGNYNEYSAVKGWDFCTGAGSPVGYAGK
jgi:subtilase family serine protease